MSPLIRRCLNCGEMLPTGSGGNLCERCLSQIPVIPPDTTMSGREKKPEIPAPLPATVGGHEVVRLLGTGGMGDVFLAREPVLGREVALKVLKDGMRTPMAIERILEEAVVTGTLTHPGIVPVYHVGRDPEVGLYYTMKPVTGRSLHDILAGLRDETREDVEKYTLPALLGVFQRVCEAVAFAHHHGIVHRDLKPSNVMIGEFGEVLVLDWGLARVVGKDGERVRVAEPVAATLGVKVQVDAKVSRDGLVLGTPGYMSPEQARGQAATATPASDVYALGAILYQILTLRNPVDGRPDEQVVRTIKGQVVPPEKRPLGQNAPRVLCQIAMKALATEQSKRFSDARELVREVDAYVEGRVPWAARNEGWEQSLGRWSVEGHDIRCVEGPRGRLLHKARLGGDLRFSALVHGVEDQPSWHVELHVAMKGDFTPDGYVFSIVGGEDGVVEFLRNGVLLARRQDFVIRAHAAHEIALIRDADALTLTIDGRRAIEHRDVFPLRGARFGIATENAGLKLTSLSIENRGVPLQLAFSALPDKLFALGRLDEARELYLEMAESHVERGEGLVARYKAAVCAIEKGDIGAATADLKHLVGTSHAALEALGRARLSLKGKNFKEGWTHLVQGCEKHRNEPLRIELWTMLMTAVDSLERQAPGQSRAYLMQLLRMAWLAPHELAQVCALMLRMATAGGGPAKAREEALALLAANPTQTSVRMELHAFLARLGTTPESMPLIRSALTKTLDLQDQITRQDRARLLPWLIESFLAGGDIPGAEKWLTNANNSLTHPSSAGLWARNWRALVAIGQGKWSEAGKILATHSATYASGRGEQNFLGTLLEALSATDGKDQDRLKADLTKCAAAAPEWAPLCAALSGGAPPETFAKWVSVQPRDVRCGFWLAGSSALRIAGATGGNDLLKAHAGREIEGKGFVAWFMSQSGESIPESRKAAVPGKAERKR